MEASKTEEVKTEDGEVQLEPTKSEMERERLISRAEQVKMQVLPPPSPFLIGHLLQLQEEIVSLSKELAEKEEELASIKKELGITAFTEFKQSMAQGWKVVGNKWKEVQETET